jgi:prepilin-type N-terminal cleavage/methylation domain-containing protein
MMPGPSGSRSGFTLLEVLLVVAILGVISSMVSVQFDGPLRKSRVFNAIERWLVIDQFLRSSTEYQSAKLVINHSGGRWSATAVRSTGEIFASWYFDPRIEVKISETQGNTSDFRASHLGEIVFQAGRGTKDYRVQIREKETVKLLEIAGGTGESKEM